MYRFFVKLTFLIPVFVITQGKVPGKSYCKVISPKDLNNWRLNVLIQINIVELKDCYVEFDFIE